MRIAPVAVAIALVCAIVTTPAAQRGRRDVPPAVAAVLASIRRADTEQYAVSEEDGRLLRVLASTLGARRALEIGGASGYSAIWIGLAIQQTGGELVTIEYDAKRAQEAKVNIDRAGLSAVVRVVAGDAFLEIPRISGTFDFVFLDAWKRDYLKFLDLTFPRLIPGGLLVAHNVVNKRDEMQDFLSAVLTRPDMLTTIVSPSSEGMSITYKKAKGPGPKAEESGPRARGPRPTEEPGSLLGPLALGPGPRR